MKKHLLGEKIDLKIESNKLNVLLFFFFLSHECVPQIPINGFCKLNSYNFSSGYSKIFPLNFNGDSYTDLLLYNPNQRTVSVIAGKANEKFSHEQKFDFPFALSNIISLGVKASGRYAFTSRKNLTAGICEFSASGKPKVISQLSFLSYPEKINIANAESDSQQEILISGPAFEGLSIVRLTDNKLTETKITKGAAYSDAVFADISNDGIADIAAINLIDNLLEFLINDGRGNFKFVRSIQLEQKAKRLRTFDMNLDSYADLVFTEGNSIRILYGDYASSYAQQVELKPKFSVDDFVIGDFNRDGKMDIAYFSSTASVVSVFFAQDDRQFYPEIVYLQKVGLQSIIPFYSKFIDGIAVLSEDGTLLTNTRLSSPVQNVDISLSINPKAIYYFDADNDFINDICYLDNQDSCLKIIMFNNYAVPSLFYSIPLRAQHDNIDVSVSNKSVEFVCYSLGKKFIETVEVNFNSNKIIRGDLYTSKPIREIKRVKEDNKLFISSLVNNKLSIEIFVKENKWRLFNEYFISDKIVSANLSKLYGMKLFFWKGEENLFKLFKKTFLPEELMAELVVKFNMDTSFNFLSIANDFFNLEKENVISFVGSGKNQYILITRDESIYSHNLKDINNHLHVNDLAQLFVGETRFNGTQRLIINDTSNEKIYKLNILNGGRKLNLVKMFDNISACRFFVKNISASNYHLVYLNQKNSCISIRQL